MRLGFVYLSCVYNEGRRDIAKRSFISLAKTNSVGLEQPVLQFTYRKTALLDIEPYIAEWNKSFKVMSNEDFPGIGGLNPLVCVSASKIFNETDCTHVGFLFDDFIFNPEWLQQLTALISRHPDGIAWSIYRSRYTQHHRIIGGDGTDVLMTMHDGVGTMSKEEWKAYNVGPQTNFEGGGGNTIDIHHAMVRPGNRWATSRDYMQNLGRHGGIEHVDCAIDFVGEIIPTFVGCLNPETDYPHIQPSMDLVRHTSNHLQSLNGSIMIPVEERYWEYGSAVHLANDYVSKHTKATVLNVGSGWDALGSTLAALDKYDITECEPDDICRRDRNRVNEILQNEGHAPIKVFNNSVFNLPKEKFDLVFCISVLEHVLNEKEAWYNLTECVKKDGVLFITVDCMEDLSRPHACDGARQTNYTLESLKDRVSMIKGLGFKTIGEPDYTWHGVHVYDYNFFRAGFIKE
jgi:hypothetical protein